MTKPKIILASTSIVRQKLMKNVGLLFESRAPHVDEQKVKEANSHLSAKDLSILLAQQKALAIRELNSLVIGADQTLSCEGKTHNKATTISELRTQLLTLRAKPHTLHSALSVAVDAEIQWSHCSEATLTMRDFSNDFLEAYIQFQGQSVLGCLGGYQLEAEGLMLFDKIDGDYFSVLGLPLMPLLAYLRSENYLIS
jgi:septum formation protein